MESAEPSVRRDAEQSDRDGRAPQRNCIVPLSYGEVTRTRMNRRGDASSGTLSRTVTDSVGEPVRRSSVVAAVLETVLVPVYCEPAIQPARPLETSTVCVIFVTA